MRRAATSWFSAVLGIYPTWKLALAGVVVVMLLLGLRATWVPARRSLSVDPLVPVSVPAPQALIVLE